MPLTGTYERSLDDKHRLAIPKRFLEDFREEALTSLYVAPGTEQCLVLYAPQGFDRLASRFAEKGNGQTETRNYIRLFYARAERVDLDGQSRIRIPDRLCDFAGLSRDVVLIGSNDRAEIWDVTRWNEFQRKLEGEFDRMAGLAFGGM
jgi:MraZ protein